MKWAIEEQGVTHLFKFNKSPLRITYIPRGNYMIFLGAQNPERIKSLKDSRFPFTIGWIEEIGEFKSEDEVTTITNSLLRGELADGLFYKFFYSYNPPKRKQSWVNKKYETSLQPKNTFIHHSTYHDNPFISKEFIEEAEATRARSQRRYDWEYLGKAIGSGVVPFDNLQVAPGSITDEMATNFDNIRPAVDFGYATDPLAYVRWHYDKKHNGIYATDGTSNTKYMTPSLTKKAAKLYVDKTDVGLPNVDNVKQASKTEFDAHATNKSNPHEVTADQLGTYTKTEADTKFKAISDLILSQDIPEGSNLDDYKTEGEFSKKTPTVVSGAPEGVTGAFRLSVRTMLGSSGIFQTLYDYATRAIYYRIGNASVGFNLPWQKTVTTDETGITRVDKLEVTDNHVYGVTTNNGWYEEKLGDNFYRWTQIFKVSANIATASGSLYNSDTLTIPAVPTGSTNVYRAITILAAPWPCWSSYFATAGGFRLLSTVVRAAGEVTLEAVLYGSKN